VLDWSPSLQTVALDGVCAASGVYFWRQIRADEPHSGETHPFLRCGRSVAAASAVIPQILVNLADGRCRRCGRNPPDRVGFRMSRVPLTHVVNLGIARKPGGNGLTTGRSEPLRRSGEMRAV
jgi:hypothetical protein